MLESGIYGIPVYPHCPELVRLVVEGLEFVEGLDYNFRVRVDLEEWYNFLRL